MDIKKDIPKFACFFASVIIVRVAYAWVQRRRNAYHCLMKDLHYVQWHILARSNSESYYYPKVCTTRNPRASYDHFGLTINCQVLYPYIEKGSLVDLGTSLLVRLNIRAQ